MKNKVLGILLLLIAQAAHGMQDLEDQLYKAIFYGQKENVQKLVERIKLEKTVQKSPSSSPLQRIAAVVLKKQPESVQESCSFASFIMYATNLGASADYDIIKLLQDADPATAKTKYMPTWPELKEKIDYEKR